MSIFAGFDDWMEKIEPGYKAGNARAKAEKERARAARAAEIVRRFGSKDAALAPCSREQLLHKALAPWRKASAAPWSRWTESIGEWNGLHIKDMPAGAKAAVEGAYPMPATFQEAKTEMDYWVQRRGEMEDVIVEFGDDGLDLAARVRADLVRDLAEHLLPTLTLPDFYERFKMFRASEVDEPEIREALFRDLTTMVSAAATDEGGSA